MQLTVVFVIIYLNLIYYLFCTNIIIVFHYIKAVYEASELDTLSEEFDASIQGGLTADGINSILAGLFTSMPNTTFSQNNGVIALTKCASRRAGYACGIWLILLGIFGKIGGVISSIPDCVLGGMVIFLFANVLVSGIALTKNVDLDSRRNRFIMAFSMALGVGVTVWPYAFLDRRASPYTAPFWECGDCSNALKGLRNGLSIFLSTGYCVGSVAAMILHGILPSDVGLAYAEDDDHQKDDLVLTENNEKNDSYDESDKAESKDDNDIDKKPSDEYYAKEMAMIEDA